MVTVDDVAYWSNFTPPAPETPELALLERTLAAVIEHITARYVVDDPLTDAQEQAVILQTSALWRRRTSIDGVAAFGEFGPIRVSTLDPHVQMLLVEHVRFG